MNLDDKLSLDDKFLELAEHITGFGGLFYDSDGTVNVYLADLPIAPGRSAPVDLSARAEAARVPVAAFLRSLNPAYADVQEIRFIRGEYDFPQLARWYARARSTLGRPGVLLTDIDERRNRLVIGVTDAAFASRIVEGLSQQGVPEGAVLVEEVGPIVAQTTLRDPVRPVLGGVSILSAGGTCTLGVNVQIRKSGVSDGRRYFVMNSHCTDEFGAVTNMRVFQPDPSNPIGVEVKDPPLFTGTDFRGTVCPSGRKCRRSDAALVEYYSSTPWDFGRVAQVCYLYTCQGSVKISGSFQLHRKAGVVTGDRVYKVGQTTGYSSGDVLRTCVDINQGEYDPYGRLVDSGRTLLCQTEASYDSDGGDSGSPVMRTYDSQRHWVGIHNSRDSFNNTSFFSTSEWVQYDLVGADGVFLYNTTLEVY